jgi:fermentation-respiration switch protein FrsA (DUF1100 family)
MAAPILRRIKRLAISAGIIYLGVVVLFYFLQNWLIFPGAGTQGNAEAIVHPDAHEQLLSLTSPDGTKIAALFGRALSGPATERDDYQSRPTILYFYGNAMCMADARDLFMQLRLLGFNVIVPEYSGYGMSGGRAGEKGCYAAADAAYDWLVKNPDIDSHRLVSFGWSIGAAVAIDLASRRKLAGVAAFSPFTSMTEMGQRVVPWLPVALILRHRFDSIGKIGSISCLIFLAHGANDELVPPEMSARLAAAAGTRATRLVVPGAGHNDIFDTGGQRLLEQFRQFVENLPRD